jgi:hypothetical protein
MADLLRERVFFLKTQCEHSSTAEAKHQCMQELERICTALGRAQSIVELESVCSEIGSGEILRTQL